MKKTITSVILCICLLSALAVPALASRPIEDFRFSAVTYAWGTSNTNFLIKTNNSTAAVVNTLANQGGFVSGSNSFTTRLRMWDSGPSYQVGYRNNIAAYTRAEVPYDYSNVIHWGIRAEFSWSNAGTPSGRIDGSWSPDAF